MTSINGANVPAALRHLAEAGYTVALLADQLTVARSTVYRWRNGQHAPNPGNLTALREWIEQTFAREANARTLTGKANHLQAAFAVLETEQERAEADAIADRIRADMAARAERDAAEQARRNEAAAQRRDEALAATRRSAYADADPFAVVATAQPREVAMW